MRWTPALLVALAALFTPLTAARATDPTVIVATDRQGNLVRLAFTGRVAPPGTVLVPGGVGTYHVAMQARGTSVSYVAITDHRVGEDSDVALVDATTGKRTPVTRSGRAGFLLVSRDGSARYVFRTNGGGNLVGLVRLDARGRARTVLAPRPRVYYSGSGISPDGRTVYVARVTEDATTLLAVNTGTGKTARVRPDLDLGTIYNVVASPDGKTLAVSHYAGDDQESATAGVTLVPVAGGAARDLSFPGDLTASSFTRDGSAVVLTVPILDDTLPVGSDASANIYLADVATGAVTPLLGTGDVYQGIVVS